MRSTPDIRWPLWTLAFLSCPQVLAQIETEGMGGRIYGDVVQYVFDRIRHGASEVRVDQYWGGEGEERPSFHDRIGIRFTCDTLAFVDYGHGSYDSLRLVRGKWWSTWQLSRLLNFTGSLKDSAGVTILRDMRTDPDSTTWWMETRTRHDLEGWYTCARSTSSNGMVRWDSTWREAGGRVRTIWSRSEKGSGRTVEYSDTRVAEVRPGLFMTVFREHTEEYTFITHSFDRRGRLRKVIVQEMDPATGGVFSRDRLRIRYRK